MGIYGQMRQVKADEIFRVCIWLYIKYLVEEGINNGLAALFLEKRPYIRELQVLRSGYAEWQSQRNYGDIPARMV